MGEETENADDDVGAMGRSKVTNVVREVVVTSFILFFCVFLCSRGGVLPMLALDECERP